MSDPGSAIERLAGDRRLAHELLFLRRHQHRSPEFHYDIIDFLHSPQKYGVVLAFRGAAKSTLAEEELALDALLKQFHNCVIVGANELRASERLQAITHELDTNEHLVGIFGNVRGRPWGQTKIVLKNGAVVQAIGRDQAVRGLKHLDWRPDLILLDDVEDRENVQTGPQREKTMRWLTGELLPVADPGARFRCLATPMDSDSVPVRLVREAGWPSLVVPVRHINEHGDWEAAWPDRYPLHEVAALERMYASVGALHVFNQEYLCDLTPGASGTVFPRLPLESKIRTYEPVYCMVDPAKSVGRTAATTGIVAWSYIGPSRIHIWHAEAGIWLPDQIIEKILWLDEAFQPVAIGVEETSLEEWVRQPLRAAALKAHKILPIKGLRAPNSKTDFIRGLQPFAKAGEITCNQRWEDLDVQLANFPSGKIDLPNALAYAQWLRPGMLVYDGFTSDHVAESLARDPARPLWLAMNATKTLVTAVLLQVAWGRTMVLADYVVEGEPPAVVPALLREVGMEARAEFRVCCGPQHWDRWNNTGLVQALQKIPMEVERGTPPDKGREALREEFGRLVQGSPSVRVARRARYVVAGLAGGYARPLDRRYSPAPEAEAGLYRTLMEGLESCLGGMKVEESAHAGVLWAETSDGRRYMRYSLAERRA